MQNDSREAERNEIPEGLRLPDIRGLSALLTQIKAEPVAFKAAPAIVSAIAVGVTAYKDAVYGGAEAEEERLSWAVSEACRHFLLLAATHGIK